MQKFDVESAGLLNGSNLIEASAGTGKTYSIAILVIRLLLEKRIPINNILLVTFTDAAASELKVRTAKFLRTALKETKTELEEDSKDEIIWRIVNQSVQATNKDEVIECLNKALLDIDKSSIHTIHGFCQRTLTEFAFETNQIFGAELVKNFDEISLRYIYEYWRSEITSIDADLQAEFSGLTIDYIKEAVDKTVSGQRLDGLFDSVSDFTEYVQKIADLRNTSLNYLEARLDEMRKRVPNFHNGITTQLKVLNLILSAEDAEEALCTKTTDKFKEMFPDEIAFCKEQRRLKGSLKQNILNGFLKDAIDVIVPKIKDHLLSNNLLTFDSLIENLHAVKDEPDLKRVLLAKYEVVFIDEFQDTDKLQYEIFKSIFQDDSKTISFFIGDPKQSIFAWRKADLNTYFNARDHIESIGKVWDMDTNYRSTSDYIEAMNKFFSSTATFNPFYFEDSEIDYYPVKSSPPNQVKKGIQKADGMISVPLQIRTNYPNKDEINRDLVNYVVTLLEEENFLGQNRIIASDIGILVRSNKEGREIKKQLEEKGVPAVVVDETSIFESAQARDLLYILNAIINPTKSNINQSLLTVLIGYKSKDLLLVDYDEVLLSYREYERLWIESGVFPLFKKVINDFGLEYKWGQDKKNGHRVLSNLYQLIELLQKIALARNYTATQQKAFLHRAINNSEKADDQYAQRIERDEDAVKIATIHKSKGLEYNIVLIPNLDFLVKETYDFLSFKTDAEEYLFTTSPIVNEEHRKFYLVQQEQENRRLIYVALTRARKNCIVFVSGFHKFSRSSIKKYIEKMASQIINENYINIDACPAIPNIEYTGSETDYKQKTLDFPADVKPSDHDWHKMSYSFLAAPYKSHSSENDSVCSNTYDQFIFKELEKGKNVGNLLHNIFEFLDFTDNSEWDQVIDISLSKFTPSLADEYRPWMKVMVEQVLDTNMKFPDHSFQLKNISNSHKINELEFDFPIKESFDMTILQSLFPEDNPREVYTGHGEVKGMLTGFIDLFFEHDGKFYILDWKSNFLGDKLEHYESEDLLYAMNQSNYHLQYMIYTLAVKKYLSSKLGNEFDYEKHFGGVIYLFLRGVRADRDTGIYHFRPSTDQLDKMEEIMKTNKK